MTDSTNKGLTIANALIQNEELLSKLYVKNSTLFPSDSKFWINISKDEMVHASWLNELLTMVKEGSVVMEVDRFNLAAINNFGIYINEIIDMTGTETISAIKALSISMDLENSLLESDIFKVYDTDDSVMENILIRLQKSTEIHFQEIKNHWNEERNKVDNI